MSEWDEVIRREPDLAGLGRAASTAAPDLSSEDFLELEQEYKRLKGKAEKHLIERDDWSRLLVLVPALAAQQRDLSHYLYLCRAVCIHFKGNGPYIPLAACLVSLSDLLELCWEQCQPPGEGRVKTLYLLDKYLRGYADEWSPKPEEAGDLRLLRAVTEGCAAQIRRRTGQDDDAFGLSALRERLRDHLRTLPKEVKPAPVAPAVKTPPAAEPVVAPVAAAAPAPATPPSVVTVAAVPVLDPRAAEFERKTRDALVQLTQLLRQRRPSDPAPYWLLRAALWSEHDLLSSDGYRALAAPPHKSALPPPEGFEALGRTIEAWFPAEGSAPGGSEEECQQLLRDSEDAVPTCALWIDLQYVITRCLRRLGWQEAEAAVVGELRHLLARFPRLLDGTFVGSKPFAGKHAQRWLRREVLASASPETAASESGAVAVSTVTDLPQGLRQLQEPLAQARSGRERFHLQLQAARLCLDHDRTDLATPLLATLQVDADTHALERWEPPLVVGLLELQLRASVTPTEKLACWARLCRLSPARAESLLPLRS